jgi:hypothetical protein
MLGVKISVQHAAAEDMVGRLCFGRGSWRARPLNAPEKDR